MRNQNRTQWAAQFLAAAELVRRDCVVSFTMGNTTRGAALTWKGFDLAFRMQYQIVSFPKNKSEEQLGM
jgi:hypothetical protein